MKLRAVLGILLGVNLSLCALIIDTPNLGISKRIPTQGDRIVWQVPLLNETDTAFEDEVTVVLRTGRWDEPLREIERVSRDLSLEPGASADVPLTWQTAANGMYTVILEIDGTDQRLVQRLPVVNRDLYFVWFGAPKDFRWCNVPTTVKDEDRDWWLRRGTIPAGWKGGVCYKEWPVERFVKSWGELDWIGIDEVGGPGEVTDTFIEAWKILHQTKPDQFVAVWFMGAHDYWADIDHLIDLFVPEIYLNYRSNHLGQYDAYFRTSRAAGVMEQVIPGLGINQVRSKDKTRVTVSPTRRDVLRQIRYIKRTAPELNGVGFFTSYSCAPGVAEYADQLCGDYFVRPVITLANPAEPVTVTHVAGDGARRLSATVANVGGMDAPSVTLEWRWGWPDEGQFRREVIKGLKVGETRAVSTTIQVDRGWLPVEVALVEADTHTLLDARGRAYATASPGVADRQLEVVVPQMSGLPGSGLLFVDVPEALQGPLAAVQRARDLSALGSTACALLPPRPGRDERQAVIMLQTDRPGPQLVTVSPGAPAQSSAPETSRTGNLLSVTTPYYRADLDLASDLIVRLSPEGGMDNLLRSPWSFAAGTERRLGEPRVERLPGCLVVTLPFSFPDGTGESQYTFFQSSPAIRVARSWEPSGTVTVSSAGDRANLFQKGGTFALQAGVGDDVRRGRLQDGSDYRDLLFGYLGAKPSPENADRAGWLDMSYGDEDADGGLGVVIEERWRDAATKSYDVTRLYDANDWIEVLYVWGTEATLDRPQRSCIYLIPHRRLDFTDPALTPPAQALWNQLHRKQMAWCPMDLESR